MDSRIMTQKRLERARNYATAMLSDPSFDEWTKQIFHKHIVLLDHISALTEQRDQLQTQLAGCSVAALGGTKDPAKQGDYGWSPAYQDVLKLRDQRDELLNAAEPLANAWTYTLDGGREYIHPRLAEAVRKVKESNHAS